MQYTKLGSTGLDVSRICLGCMSYGEPDRGNHSWTLSEADSRPFIQRALEAGINFFDTANVYSDGSSEEIVGRALADFTRPGGRRDRDQGARPDATGPNGVGPVPQGHPARDRRQPAPASAPTTSTCTRSTGGTRTPRSRRRSQALHDVVRAGKARYIGASSMWAWQFSKALHLADDRGWTRFVSMQNHYNLLNREEEREMLPLCLDEGIGVIPWSPLARGKLTRDWDATTTRSESDAFGRTLYDTSSDDRTIVARVADVAAARGVSRAQVALAWVLSKPAVSAPIIGATRPQHLEDAIAAVDLTLEDKEIESLEEAYGPHPVVGFG